MSVAILAQDVPGHGNKPRLGIAPCRAALAMASSAMQVQKATIDLSSFSDDEDLVQVMGLLTEKSAWKGHRSWALLGKTSIVMFFAPECKSWVVCDRRNLQQAFVWNIVGQVPGRYDLPPTGGWVGFGSSEFIECDISMVEDLRQPVAGATSAGGSTSAARSSVEPELKTEVARDARPGPVYKRLRLNKDGLPANAVLAAPVPVEAEPSQPRRSPQPPLVPPPALLTVPTPPPPPQPAVAGTVEEFVEHVKSSKRQRGGWYEKAQAICQAVNTSDETGDFTMAVQLCKLWGFKDRNNQAPTKAAALGILQECLSQVMAATAAAVADEAAVLAKK